MFAYVCLYTHKDHSLHGENDLEEDKNLEKRSEITVTQVRYNGGLNKNRGYRDTKGGTDSIWGPKANLLLEVSSYLNRLFSVTQVER